jgi:hypothetical protein
MLVVSAVILTACAVGPRPASAPAARAEPLYWADLGPAELDVAGYPTEKRRDYAVYASVCSRCHTLARSLNAPAAGRGRWEAYMMGMRLIGKAGGAPPITAEERRAILDFLEYDSKARKAGNARFSAQSAELKRRFDPILRRRMQRLQESPQPVLLPPRP